MIKLIRLLLAATGIVLVVWFAVANRNVVEVGFWPFALTIDLPLYGVFLTGIFAGVLLGGLAVWFGSLKHRFAGSRARRQVLEAETQRRKQEEDEERAAILAGRKRREALAIEAPSS